jgi:hypothetical protein
MIARWLLTWPGRLVLPCLTRLPALPFLLMWCRVGHQGSVQHQNLMAIPTNGPLIMTSYLNLSAPLPSS